MTKTMIPFNFSRLLLAIAFLFIAVASNDCAGQERTIPFRARMAVHSN
jgi:hypothetical protein